MTRVLSSLMAMYGYKTPLEVLQTLTFKQITELTKTIEGEVDYLSSMFGYKVQLVMATMLGSKEEAKKANATLFRSLNTGEEKADRPNLFASDFTVENQKIPKSKRKKKHGN